MHSCSFVVYSGPWKKLIPLYGSSLFELSLVELASGRFERAKRLIQKIPSILGVAKKLSREADSSRLKGSNEAIMISWWHCNNNNNNI